MPKPSLLTRGRCAACHGVFAKRQMLPHVGSCPKLQDSPAPPSKSKRRPAPPGWAHLLVEGPRAGAYWLHMGVNLAAPLEALDDMLRGVWLECCGHMSQFHVGDVRYVSHGDEGPRERGMDRTLGEALQDGATTFTYEYDFGSTTELRLRVLAVRPDRALPNPAQVLARNLAPAWPCQACGAPASLLCNQCEKGLVCRACARKHRCGDDMLLPLANSPRAGVCGYSGDGDEERVLEREA